MKTKIFAKKWMITLVLALAFAILLTFLIVAGCPSRGDGEEKQNHYEIEAIYDGNKTLTGKMTLNFVNDSEAKIDKMYFHLYPQAYREGARFPAVNHAETTSAYPSGINYGGVEIGSVVAGKESKYEIEGQDEDILRVDFLDGIDLGESVSVSVEFTVTIPEVRHRLGKSGDTVNLGGWYPVLCAYDEYGWETSPYYNSGDPFVSEVASYDVTLTIPKGYDAVVSGSKEVSAVEGGLVVKSKIENARDFAVVIGKFRSVRANIDGIEVSYYGDEGDDLNAWLKVATDSLRTFNATFGKYPYPQYSVVKTAFLHGGMEYPALSMVSDALNKDMFTEAIIHETAHQWWYAVVGSDQINHAWQDEGLTEYSTTLFYEKNPTYGVTRGARLADAASAYLTYMESALPSDYRMDKRLTEFNGQIDYTFLTYVKGELMFDSVRSCMGDEKFFTALKNYYQNNRFKIASPAHLICEMEKAGLAQAEQYIGVWLSGKDIVCR